MNQERVLDTGSCFRTITRNLINPLLAEIWHPWEKNIRIQSERQTVGRDPAWLGVLGKPLFKGEPVPLHFKTCLKPEPQDETLHFLPEGHFIIEPPASDRTSCFSQVGLGRSLSSDVPLWFKGQVAINSPSCSKYCQTLFQVATLLNLLVSLTNVERSQGLLWSVGDFNANF